MPIANRTARPMIQDWVRRSAISDTNQQPIRQQHLQPGVLPLKAVTDERIDPDGSGEVTVWRKGEATEETLIAWLNWHHGNKAVSAGKQVTLLWFGDEGENGKWVIMWAECERDI